MRRRSAALSMVALFAAVLGAATDGPALARDRTRVPADPAAFQIPVGNFAGPLLVVVNLADQRLTVYDRMQTIARTAISSGKPGHETPTGVFSIIQRNREHVSNLYDDAPMPFMQRLTWSGIALHEGVVPRRPASHGCIRMPAGFAERLWQTTSIGTRVIVSPTDVAPISVRHRNLPVPAEPEPVPSHDGGRDEPLPHVSLLVPTAGGEAPPISVAQRLYARAMARKVGASEQRTSAERAVKPAHEQAARRAAEARQAAEGVRVASRMLMESETALERTEAAARANGIVGEAIDLDPGVMAARLSRDQAQGAMDRLRDIEQAASDAAFSAAIAARESVMALEAAREGVRIADISSQPISVLVSRRAGRVFVRQGFLPLHEEPIVIADAGQALGTHVFTAVDDPAAPGGLAWSVISLPPEPGAAAVPDAGRALERFELPSETARIVAERLWRGASIIVTDHRASPETGQGTDFVILTRHGDAAR